MSVDCTEWRENTL